VIRGPSRRWSFWKKFSCFFQRARLLLERQKDSTRACPTTQAPANVACDGYVSPPPLRRLRHAELETPWNSQGQQGCVPLVHGFAKTLPFPFKLRTGQTLVRDLLLARCPRATGNARMASVLLASGRKGGRCCVQENHPPPPRQAGQSPSRKSV